MWDYFDVARLQFDGRAIAFHAAAVDRLATAFEKVRQAVAETRQNAGDDRQEPRTVALNEIGLVLDAFDGTRDHWSFLFVQDFSADCHISKTVHTCASPFVGVMAGLSKPMTAMLHPLLSCRSRSPRSSTDVCHRHLHPTSAIQLRPSKSSSWPDWLPHHRRYGQCRSSTIRSRC